MICGYAKHDALVWHLFPKNVFIYNNEHKLSLYFKKCTNYFSLIVLFDLSVFDMQPRDGFLEYTPDFHYTQEC